MIGVFDEGSVAEIIADLEFEGSEAASGIAKTMLGKSPTSLCIAFEQMRRGASMDFREAMRMEYRIVSRILDGKDFYEGVRAVLVDKDQKPQWDPGSLDQIDNAVIEAYFAPLGDTELRV